MDFFAQQDLARRRTGRLVALFLLAVLATVACVYAVGLFVAHWIAASASGDAPPISIELWRPDVLLIAGGGALAVITLGSLSKITQLRAGGGAAIASHLGGRRLDGATTDPVEKRVLNVVEEMAIAAGTPVPPVFIMDNEPGINAFAAGYEPASAVVGITRGAAERLSRDELQGVIAHEFSHILSGDMRLNIRLTGLLHGILVIGIIGHTLLRMAGRHAMIGGRRRNEGNAAMLIIAVGAALAAIGFIGTFFGNLIKAGVSRQREFLADASAVQFTRNPRGIADALRRIGGVRFRGTIRSPAAPEASHMFFARAITSGLEGMFATHPPLPERIRRIDPSWDGTMLASETPTKPVAQLDAHPAKRAAAFTDAAAAASLLDQIGTPTNAHLALARERLVMIPAALRHAASEPYGARAAIIALLLDTEPGARRAQIAAIGASDPRVRDETARLAPAIGGLARDLRLTLVEIALPALSSLSEPQRASFSALLRALANADQRIDLFEFCLLRIVDSSLEAQRRPSGPGVRYYGLARLERECATLLSAVARAGSSDRDAARAAFAAGATLLGLRADAMVDREALTIDSLGAALDELRHVAPKLCRQILHACAATVAHDHEVTPHEAELLRAVAESLGVPAPPLLPGQRLA